VLALQSSAAFSGDLFFLDIWNQDDSKVQACGNGTRCVMGWLMDEKKTNEVTLNSMAGPLRGQRTGSEEVQVFQEAPRRGHSLDLSVWGLPQGFHTHVGNPHLVIFR